MPANVENIFFERAEERIAKSFDMHGKAARAALEQDAQIDWINDLKTLSELLPSRGPIPGLIDLGATAAALKFSRDYEFGRQIQRLEDDLGRTLDPFEIQDLQDLAQEAFENAAFPNDPDQDGIPNEPLTDDQIWDQQLPESEETTDSRSFFEQALQAIFSDPLVLDLDGDGIELLNMSEHNVQFDITGDGITERVGWVAPDDALLVRDKNGNGVIDGIDELYGSQTQTGFDQLREEELADSEDAAGANGVIDAADGAFYDELALWQDSNSDGLVQAGELTSLADAGIASLDARAGSVQDDDRWVAGNLVIEVSEFERADGTSGELAEVLFSIDSDGNATGANGLIVSNDPAVAGLPESRGYGQLDSWSVAMANDAVLLGMVQNFTALTEFSGVRSDVEAILYQWAGVSNVAESSRGGEIDARALEAMEALFDTPFMFGGTEPNPTAQQAGILEQSWEVLVDQFTARLLVQGPLDTIFTNASYDYVSDSLALGDDLTTIMGRVGTELDASDIAVMFEVRDILVEYPDGLNATEADINQAMVGVITDALGSGAALNAILAAFDADAVVDTSVLKYSNYFGDTREVYEGSFRDDLVIGQGDGAILEGGDGTDVLVGTGGDDLIFAGSESYNGASASTGDQLFGGDGNDIFRLSTNSQWNAPNDENLLVVGGNGDDTFVGRNVQNSTFDGGAGDDNFSSLSGSNLTISLGDGVDTFQWSRFGPGNIQNSVIDFGAGDDNFSGSVNNNNKIFGGAGNDTIFGGSTNGASELGDGVIDGGEGDDTISVGKPSNMIIHGGEGDDTITASNASPFGNAPTFLNGDAGNDAIIINGNSGNYHINDGAGDDTITKTGYARTTITIAADAGSTDTIDSVEWFYNQQDWQTGETTRYSRYDTQISLENFPAITSFDDLIITAQGSDSVIALPNGQTLLLKDIAPADVQPTFFVGAAGSGTHNGTDINDRIIGSNVTDEGASGADIIDGKAGNDWLDGGEGADLIRGGAGNDTIIGGIGADILIGGKGDDLYLGGASGGTDRDGVPYNNASTDTDGDIFVITKDGDSTDTISWFSDFHGDKIDLSAFAEISSFDDLQINFQQWSDTTITLPDGQSLIINSLRSGTLTASDFIFSNTVDGTTSAETLTGTESGDGISGLEGNDILFGLGGDDTLDGGAGEDRLTGGGGADVFRFSALGDSTKTHDDRITDFVDGEDMIDVSGLGFYSVIESNVQTSSDTILRLTYSSNTDRTYLRNDQNDFQLFLDGDYRGLITSDDMVLDAPAGVVTITGTNGNNTLIGGVSDDHITGRLGADTLTGGAGSDHFIYTDVNDSQKFGDKDRITDFEVGVDVIDVSALGFTSFIGESAGLTSDITQLRLTYSSNADRTYLRNDQTEFDLFLDGDYRISFTENELVLGQAPQPQTITGTAGDDVNLDGANGDDTISGLAGNDWLDGGAGDDVLEGGAGADRLTGGDGVDVFLFSDVLHSQKFGDKDRIIDFEDGIDMIDVSGLGFDSFIGETGATASANELRMSYSSATDRTYIRNEQNEFDFFLDGDFRTSLTADDFVF